MHQPETHLLIYIYTSTEILGMMKRSSFVYFRSAVWTFLFMAENVKNGIVLLPRVVFLIVEYPGTIAVDEEHLCPQVHWGIAEPSENTPQVLALAPSQIQVVGPLKRKK